MDDTFGVTQEDRENAASEREKAYAEFGYKPATLQTPTEIRRGERDGDELVQKHAMARLSGSTTPAAPQSEDATVRALKAAQTTLWQYISDLWYPPTGDSVARRIAAAEAASNQVDAVLLEKA